MHKLNINLISVLSALLFSVLYAFLSYSFISLFTDIVYIIIFTLVLTIIYINILRKFIFEIFTLEKGRATEMFAYLLMYVVTVSAIIFPFVFEPIIVFELPILRYLIIGFATILLTKYAIFMLLGPWHDIKMRLKHKIYFEDVEYTPLVSVVIPAWNEGVGY